VSNPDYATLLKQIAEETDPVLKQQLIEQCYVFNEPLTEEEKSLFDYVDNGYVKDNPGYNNEFKSYVGTYYDEEGNIT
jgi:hypothetical protein